MNIRNLVLPLMPSSMRRYVDRIEASPIGNRLAKGAFWSFNGMVISRVLQMLASVCVARTLGKEHYGELGIVGNTADLFGVFAGFKLGLMACKHVAEFRNNDPIRAGRIMALSGAVAVVTGGVIAIAVLLLAPWLADHTLHAPHLVGLVRIAAGIVFFDALAGAQSGALSGFEAFKAMAWRNLWAGIISVPIMIGGVLLAGVEGGAWGMMLGSAARWSLNHLALRKEARCAGVPFQFSGCLQEYKLLWSFSLPAVLASAMAGPVNYVCNTKLVRQSNGFAEMGLLSVANQWNSVIWFIPSILMQVLLPIFSSAYGSSNQGSAFHKSFKLSQGIMVLVAFPVATAIMFSSDLILRLYGSQYLEGVSVLIGVVAGALIQLIGAAGGPALQAKGRMWLGFIINATWGATFVVFVYCFVGHLGPNAIAYGSAFAYIVTTLWTYIYLSPELPAGTLRRMLLSIAYVIVLTAICLMLSPAARLWTAIPAVMLSTTISAYVLSGLELHWILKRAKTPQTQRSDCSS